ncbi:hypothetical protein [Sutcliffiella rhizosphaerae]|uniref:Uncharacterized protein n=1 Tax=Sutcliffiella rhizosphaerae TaxID=2880967 RepID=A0ABM8YL10_9BACI|nr:hypothetical protein [Sutcliffiella rhizosphaerae]CAG9620641.1 hypothetical protein BACCIP111883_01410 [Sutcliffiella rhizosphaerae]
MEYFFPVIAVLLLGVLVLSGSGVMAYLNGQVHFIVVVLTMAVFGILYSMIANITGILPVIITVSTLLSLVGIWIVRYFRFNRNASKELGKLP